MPNHKKNSIILTLSKLPGATGKACTILNARNGLVLNRQIDADSKLAQDMMNMLHTHHGDINGTCLGTPAWLCETFFENMYNTGIIP